MGNSFKTIYCLREYSPEEALLLVQRLVQLALLWKQVGYASKTLNPNDSSFKEQKELLNGSLSMISEQMAMQLLQFSGNWDHNLKEE